MAPLPLVPLVFQVTTFGTLNGLPCDHVINWYTTVGTSNLVAVNQAFAAADAAHWMDNMKTLLPPWYTHTSSRSVYLGDPNVPEATTSVQIVGTSPLLFGPHNTCVTSRHIVPVRGRGKQGRTNIPGPIIELLDGTSGNLTADGQSQYDTNFKNYLSTVQTQVQGITGVVPQLVIVDRKLGTFNQTTGSSVDFQINTHRRWQKRLSRHR